MTAHKAFARVEVKDDARGLVEAVFSTFNVVDSDGDVTLPGAFTDGATVPISAYGHKSWEGALPVGVGTIRQTPTAAVLEGRFFLDTVSGRDTFTVVKHLGPLGQWSYGYDVALSERGERDGMPVQVLRRLKVHEVSPVLVGAGVDTRTLTAKGRSGLAPADQVRREFLRFVALSAGLGDPQSPDPTGRAR